MKTTTETTRPELSFDGCGINGPDEYRTRLATFNISSPHYAERKHYGNLFAAAPELLAALEATTQWCADLEESGYACPDLLRQARAAIVRAKSTT